MKKNQLALIAIGLLSISLPSCATKNPAKPNVNTAQVGENLNDQKKSLEDAQCHVKNIKSNLNDIDDKAIKIQDAIRNW